MAAPPVASLARVAIVAMDPGCDLAFSAQYNPAQLQLDESANWSPHPNGKANLPSMEFTGGGARTLSLELFFDTYESGGSVKTAFVDALTRLVRVIDPDGPEEQKRPPIVQVRWGTGMPTFIGVINSLSTKLTMFLPDGTPVRATCSVKLTEASFESFQPRPANRVTRPR
ncbi:MAG TPA: hypothetical protein VHE35_18650 [Kofleriaceae bacterium]|nr:hypothetical protein [Kofleriaceae bacterium]